MNSPITSPCPAVLTSSPTITFTPAASAWARASSAPDISLWSVTAITRGGPPSVPSSRSCGLPRAARSALRDSRTRSCECDGASTSTRCPRRESSVHTRSTCALTSLSCASHGYGLTWAIENDGAIGSTIMPAARAGGGGLLGGGRLDGFRFGACRRLGRYAFARRSGPPVLGAELLRVRARLVIRALVVRRLHQVGERSVELAAEAVVE